MLNDIQVLENGQQNIACFNLQSKLLQNGIIMITDTIDSISVASYQAQLFYLLSLYKEGDVITIYINSPGGSVYDGLGIIDTIRLVQKKGIIVRIINIGAACSMAALILMSGSVGHREATKNSSVMLHEISSFEYGKTSNLEDHMQEIKRLQDIVDSIIEENSSKELIKLSNRKDLWLSAEEAKNFNIIDNIL